MSKYTEHLRVTAKALLEIADEQDKREASPQPVATMGKIKIGENEYRLPVTIDSCEETYTCISDEDCKEVSKNDMVLALNELAQLRADRDALLKRVEELGLAVKAYKEKHQGCHTMEFSPCATCDFIDAVQEWVDDTKNTTPGGDE